ncbi:MAG: NAD+ synthase [Acidimicrobiia bacterium]|nr:NAD+ synthase [Acidimicrobiia bacterium]MXX44805.1 NAD+ synthase [Acidimicrobiia bacterium]MXY74348.1 NAD+ synthase [Acidimicrobiia bacterium]MYA38059.1 NAD+ synthase [Acidimicrobiia bacterium]MYB79434.1 NAD+ synthase [Acidimicrobiia bacterium]
MAMRIAGAQLNFKVGDLEGNCRRILDAMAWASGEKADLLVLPELATSGYPPEDLALRADFLSADRAVLERLAERSDRTVTVVGCLDSSPSDAGEDDAAPRRVANAAAILGSGRILGVYHKEHLPNYGVFDERRWFYPGRNTVRTWPVGPTRVGVSVCEDLWMDEGPWRLLAGAGAGVIVNINASPYHLGKAAEREALVSRRAREAGAAVVYLNLVGGQDELVFDGASLVAGSDGAILYRAAQFTEERFLLDLPPAGAEAAAARPQREWMGAEEEVWEALKLAVRDYLGKNRFGEAVVGLSGGIDSAVTACLAADALGPDRVWGVSMPSVYSSEHSKTDAKRLSSNLGIRFDMVPIERAHAAFVDTLSPVMGNAEWGVAGENLQARARGSILMALSNRHGGLVLATGNKSELSVGYATLYGDMVGAFAPLKDVYKTLVYRLAEWRNRQETVIPVEILTKPPSAELRPDQLDTDSLPPYDVLDSILAMYIDSERSMEEIAAAGFDPALVRRVVGLVEGSEYKRRQSAPGPKVTTKSLGRERRRPITSGWNLR